jgi:hypothetical protein
MAYDYVTLGRTLVLEMSLPEGDAILDFTVTPFRRDFNVHATTYEGPLDFSFLLSSPLTPVVRSSLPSHTVNL